MNPIFRSERLILKPLQPTDIHDIYHMHRFPEVIRFGTISHPKSPQDTEQLLASSLDTDNDQHHGWTIRLASTDEFLGEMGLHLAAPRFKMGEIHYGLLPTAWGKGYATEAVKTLITECMRAFNLHRIEAGVAVDNEGSVKLLEKVGMTREGRKRKVLPIRGEWVDNFHYAILTEDLTTKKSI